MILLMGFDLTLCKYGGFFTFYYYHLYFINKIISEFTPIHLKLNINYLTIDEMKNFENIYFYWLSMLQVSNGKDFQKTSFDLISLMNKS